MINFGHPGRSALSTEFYYYYCIVCRRVLSGIHSNSLLYNASSRLESSDRAVFGNGKAHMSHP